MKPVVLRALGVFAVLWLAAGCDMRNKPDTEAEAWLEERAYLNDNRDFLLSVVNGQIWAQSLVAMYASSNLEYACIHSDVEFELMGRDITVAGTLAEKPHKGIFGPFEVSATVGISGQQPVNALFNVRKSSREELLKSDIGQRVIFRGRLDYLRELSHVFLSQRKIDNSELVDIQDYDQALKFLPALKGDIADEVISMAAPFESAPEPTKRELLEMSKCAELAYPGIPLPDGYSALTPQEWSALGSALGMADELYDRDGYLVLGNGLRGRILHGPSGNLVVSWSGCDLDKYENIRHGITDFVTCVKYVVAGCKEDQFRQVTNVCNAVIETLPGEVWVVGHSLGGALTAFCALNIPDGEYGRVRCATFNGLGVSGYDFSNSSPATRAKAAAVLSNVYCSADPVYTLHRPVRKYTGALSSYIAPRHLGKSYFITYDEAEVFDNAMYEEWKNKAAEKTVEWILKLLPEQVGLLSGVLPMEEIKSKINDMLCAVLDMGNDVVNNHEIGVLKKQMELLTPAGKGDTEEKAFPPWVIPAICVLGAIAAAVLAVWAYLHLKNVKSGMAGETDSLILPPDSGSRSE